MAAMRQNAPEAADAVDGGLDPSTWKIAGVALFGALLAQLDATIVNVSLSSLAAELNSSLSTIQWVTSGYLLALILTDICYPLRSACIHFSWSDPIATPDRRGDGP